MRDIKFKLWHNNRMYGPLDIYEVALFGPSGVGSHGNTEGTWLQYIGLKDKKGKEMYEGDVLFNPSLSEGEQYRFIKAEMEYMESEWRNVIGWGIPLDTSEYEVVGNIFENPDLIEKVEWLREKMRIYKMKESTNIPL